MIILICLLVIILSIGFSILAIYKIIKDVKNEEIYKDDDDLEA